MLVLKGYKPKPAVKLCQTQQIMGEFYLWEYPASNDCQAVENEAKSMGARKMKAEGQVSWTNSLEIEKAVEELDKRKVPNGGRKGKGAQDSQSSMVEKSNQ